MIYILQLKSREKRNLLGVVCKMALSLTSRFVCHAATNLRL